MAFAAVITPIQVYAQNTNLGVNIIQITPTSVTGGVGSGVTVQGTIYTSNGSYRIVLGNVVVDSGKAQGYYVFSNFTIPEVPAGSYALTLTDADINVNSTQTFTVTVGYAINAVPSAVQEGANLVLNVSVTGGSAGASYSVTVAVALPSPVSTVYSKTLSLGTANSKGTANAQVAFPDSTFSPSGSLTDYAGTYTVYFNQSQSLAQNTFAVNFISSTTFHRGETVGVRATGYQPSEPATLTITSAKSSTAIDTFSTTASTDGIITSNWVVSAAADIGDYTIKITPQNTQKAIQDSQTFTVTGYSIKVQTNSIAGAVVSGVSLQAQDPSTGTVSTAVSGPDGIANFKLEKGNQGITALWNGVNVGQTNITVNGDATFSIQVQLVDLKITVKSANGIAMPFVNLNILYRYQSSEGSKTGNATGQTDSSGSFTLHSTLPGASYTIDASVYNQIFNAANNTVNSLPTQAIVQVFIVAPSETVTLNVVGFNQQAIAGARIELVELSNGLFYSATADSNGGATIQATFGTYRARVYKDNALINETNVQVFSSSQQQIRCTLYGIQLSVKVVDFFGSPISNANVTLNGPEKISVDTKGDGTATFNDIIGGNMQIIAQASGTKDASQAITVTVNQPTSVQIKIEKYVALGSLLIQTSSLASMLIVLVAIIGFALVEVFRRRRNKNAAAA